MRPLARWVLRAVVAMVVMTPSMLWASASQAHQRPSRSSTPVRHSDRAHAREPHVRQLLRNLSRVRRDPGRSVCPRTSFQGDDFVREAVPFDRQPDRSAGSLTQDVQVPVRQREDGRLHPSA